jgi:hypothetical protein
MRTRKANNFALVATEKPNVFCGLLLRSKSPKSKMDKPADEPLSVFYISAASLSIFH